MASIREVGERFAYRHHFADLGVERGDMLEGQLLDLVAGAFMIAIQLKQRGHVLQGNPNRAPGG